MYATVRDLIALEKMKGFKIIAGAGGLENPVEKIGILDFEFTREGAAQCIDSHWMPHDFVITTFLYARDNESLLESAVKKLHAFGVSGLAIKNVFGLKLPREIIRYANQNHFPIFVFTDNSLFFEDIVIWVNDLISSFSDTRFAEAKICQILHQEQDKNQVKELAREINPSFWDSFFAAYFKYKVEGDAARFPSYISSQTRRALEVSGISIVRYRTNFFYIASADPLQKLAPDKSIDQFCATFGLQRDDFFIGVSHPQNYLTNFKKALLQSVYASNYAQLQDEPCCAFADIGVFQLLLPYADDEWMEEFYQSFVAPIVEYDLGNKANLLEFALTYERFYGNSKEIARLQNIHENTIRYRLGKIKSILGFTGSQARFEEQLLLAMKIHRIKSLA